MISGVAVASIPRRVVAYAIDVVLAFAGVVALQAVLLPINPLLGGVASPSGVLLHAWVTLTVTVLIVLFHPRPIWDSPSPGFRMGFLVVYALLFVYLAVTLWTPQRQGPHDLVAGTIVSRTEPPG